MDVAMIDHHLSQSHFIHPLFLGFDFDFENKA